MVYNGENTGVGPRSIGMARFDTDLNLLSNNVYGSSSIESFSTFRRLDDGIIVLGFTTSFGGGRKALVFKLDNSGSLTWSKTINVDGNDDTGTSINIREDGTILVSLFSETYQDFVFVTLDASGNALSSFRSEQSFNSSGAFKSESFILEDEELYIGKTSSFNGTNALHFISGTLDNLGCGYMDLSLQTEDVSLTDISPTVPMVSGGIFFDHSQASVDISNLITVEGPCEDECSLVGEIIAMDLCLGEKSGSRIRLE